MAARVEGLFRKMQTAREELTSAEGLDAERWHRFTEEILFEAQVKGDFDGLVEISQFTSLVLEAEGRYEDIAPEIDHTLERVPDGSVAAAAMLTLKASVLGVMGNSGGAAEAHNAAGEIFEGLDTAAHHKWLALHEGTRCLLLQPPSDRLPALMACEEGSQEGLLVLLNWRIPFLVANGAPREETDVLVAQFERAATGASYLHRQADAMWFEAWRAAVSSAEHPSSGANSPNRFSEWRLACLRLYTATLRRDAGLAEASLEGLTMACRALGPMAGRSLECWSELVRAVFRPTQQAFRERPPTSTATLLTVASGLVASMAAALSGTRADARVWQAWIARIGKMGVKSSVQFPVSRKRVEALLLLRMGRSLRARRLLASAVRESLASGVVIEAAIARVQWAEVSTAIMRAPRASWEAKADGSRRALLSAGVDPEPTLADVRRLLGHSVAGEPCPSITSREIEILRLITDGYTNREIAGELELGLSSVNRHVSYIYAKLGVFSRSQASRAAHSRGLV